LGDAEVGRWGCESWLFPGPAVYGNDEGACVAWSSARVDGLDLDLAPPGSSHWDETTVAVSLSAQGAPYPFSFEVPLTLRVTYS
jgi:hypothetical protein